MDLFDGVTASNIEYGKERGREEEKEGERENSASIRHKHYDDTIL